MKKIFAMILVLAVLMSCTALAEGETIYSVTTGLPTDKTEQKVVGVQFDNSVSARPQMNMSRADVIYEVEIAAGGYTRYTAFYNDDIPELVEATRSARMHHIDLALDWDAVFIHYGGQNMAGTSIYDYVKTVQMKGRYDGLTNSTDFYRDVARVAPYNVITKLGQIYGYLNEKHVTTHTPLKFDAENYTKKGDTVTEFEIPYRPELSFYPSYKYEDGKYVRYYCGEKQIDGGTNEGYEFANVIVMKAIESYYNKEYDRPIVELYSKNKCDYFIDGSHFTGYWVRTKSTVSTTYYDDDGNEVIFKPGKTFIQVINNSDLMVIK